MDPSVKQAYSHYRLNHACFTQATAHHAGDSLPLFLAEGSEVGHQSSRQHDKLSQQSGVGAAWTTRCESVVTLCAYAL